MYVEISKWMKVPEIMLSISNVKMRLVSSCLMLIVPSKDEEKKQISV